MPPGPATSPRPGRGSRRTAQGALSRERILEAAVELFAERGYAATSVEALCRRAEVARTALYWHFGSKEGLLAAALDRVAGAWIEGIRKSAYQAGDPVERLDRAVAGMRALVEESPELLRLLLTVLLERAEGDARARETLRRIFDRARRALAQGIEDALGAPIPDADEVAHVALALLQAASLRRELEGDAVDLERLFRSARRTLLLLIDNRARRAGVPLPPPGEGGRRAGGPRGSRSPGTAAGRN